MILSILIALLLAKINHYSIKPVFRCIWLLPFLTLELIHGIFQIAAFHGYFDFIQYAELLKTAYLYVLIIPVIVYKLYKVSLVGACLILIGTTMNNFVIIANEGKMPVYPTISKWTGYFDYMAIENYDTLHALGNHNTNLKLFTDYIDVGFGILSIGDLLIHSFTILILFYTTKALNLRSNH